MEEVRVKEEIDHDCTDEIVCPYCGYEEGDSWEYSSDSQEIDCLECGKTFQMNRNITVDYTTEKISKKEQE